ncbi:Gfo/Idh/MocA family protein [Alicyclobacillus acidiphilus]|uniref:Gfo/Idh/MocA family protein n=1 Tax=Alicyclobacillus acidiphilus TaxID=182455 RepID=UPI00082AFFBF|nr:Gfo/Idh/MocA family oxidoreductase [Alicyclobacillus acidiphilus]
MKAKIRMGVVGLGGISNVHIQGILRSVDAELVAICDTNAQLLQATGDKYGIPAQRRFSEFAELIGADFVDAVSICTPNMLHFPIAMEAVRQKKPFCLEKPIALNAKEAEQLRDACRTANVPNMIGFSYRYKPAVRYARSLVQEGQLGRIYHVYGQYLQSWAKPDVPMSWRFSKAMSGSGALGDLGSHVIDLTRFIVGDIKRVTGNAGILVGARRNPGSDTQSTVDVDDYVHFLATIESDISGVFSISRFAYGRGNYQRLEIYGDKGALVYSLEADDSLEVCIGSVYEQSHQFVEVPIPARFHQDQMQSFFDLVRGVDDGLNATLDDGVFNQKALDAIEESFECGKWIEID